VNRWVYTSRADGGDEIEDEICVTWIAREEQKKAILAMVSE
jgi:hypothetical protein